MTRTWLVLLALTPSAIARADEATARNKFDAGDRAYNLGQFDKAIVLFTEAFEQWPEPAFLFNLAQTYRQIGDCKQASFFYKRYLALKENDAKKPIKPERRIEVEKRIAELEECIKRDLASKPPTQLDDGKTGGGGGTKVGGGTAGGTTAGGTKANGTKAGGTQTATGGGGEGGEVDEGEGGEGEDGEGDDGDGITKKTSEQPTLVSVRIGLGAGKLNAGDLGTKLQFVGTFVGGYPLVLTPEFRLDLGAAFSFTPVPYETLDGMSGSGSVIGLVANVSPTYLVAPKISVRADVGVGVQLFSGLGMMGNPFTEGGFPASGALSSVLVRTALSGDYAITPNLVVTLSPIVFTYSPAPSGFLASISSLTTISALVGVAYQL